MELAEYCSLHSCRVRICTLTMYKFCKNHALASYEVSICPSEGCIKGQVAICGDAAHPMMPNLGQGGCQATEDGYRLAEELSTVKHTKDIEGALSTYYKKRIPRTTIIQIMARLGSDLLVDFDKMMTIPLVGPFFLTMTHLSMPFSLAFLYTPEF